MNIMYVWNSIIKSSLLAERPEYIQIYHSLPIYHFTVIFFPELLLSVFRMLPLELPLSWNGGSVGALRVISALETGKRLVPSLVLKLVGEFFFHLWSIPASFSFFFKKMDTLKLTFSFLYISKHFALTL